MTADRQYKYLTITEVPTTVVKKTRIWNVHSIVNGFILGQIRWSGAWRTYVFFPEADTLFEHNCLWDIADFVAKETSAHRETWKKKKCLAQT